MRAVLALLVMRHASGVPLTLSLEPEEERCIYAELLAKPAVLETLVERGASLDVHVTLTGPYAEGASGLPKSTNATATLFDSLVAPMLESADLSDAYRHEFEPEADAIYQACVHNARAHFRPKIVQLSLRGEDEGEAKPVETRDSSVGDSAARIAEKARANAARGLKPNGVEYEHKAAPSAQDLDRVAQSVKNLKKLANQVVNQQARDRNRLEVHASLNEESHNNMVVGSLMETVVFIGVSLFQIFYVRRWFEGRERGAKKRGAKNWA